MKNSKFKEQLRKCFKPTRKERLLSIDASRDNMLILEEKIGLSYDKVIERLKSGEMSETLDVCYLLMAKQVLNYDLKSFSKWEEETNSYIKPTSWQEIKKIKKS
jgi:hypothetical protein